MPFERHKKDRKTYDGLLRRLSSKQFLLDLALMYDTLCELSLLSVCLQKLKTTIVQSDKLIHRSIHFIVAFKERPGTKALEAEVAIRKENFEAVSLTDNSKIIVINRQQFLTSTVNNLTRRMFTATSSHTSTGQSVSDSENKYKEEPVAVSD
ncbi:UNVERIFIED_CONTAM: hypothetical protein FKN15_023032 [Acipenser sinensis]